MEKEIIHIADKEQRLTDVLPNKMIQTNTILNKHITGLGATYSELKAPRHSIIIEPNVPVIKGKMKDPKHKNVFGVYEGIYADDILDYLEKGNKYHKVLTTPESFRKVKDAFAEYGMDIYNECFLLFDECQKIIQDVSYRQDIVLPINDFFKFKNKAFVSATPILPSDPRFEENKFKEIEIQPDFDYKQNIHLLTTNNVLGTLRTVIEKLQEYNSQNETSKNICIFLNSTDTIEAIIKQLKIEENSVVFCSEKSVVKLKSRGYQKAYEDWEKKRMKKYSFFTSRFYSALDIELEETIDLIMISDLYYAEHSMIDPNTEAPQIIGRFRNGVSTIVHITNLKSDFPICSKEEIDSYLRCSEEIYLKIKNLYDTTSNFSYRLAYKEALSVIPYNKYLNKDGSKNYFAIDNHIDEEIIKSYYNNKERLTRAYNDTNRFVVKYENAWFPLGDIDRLKRQRDDKSLREKNIETIRQLGLLNYNGEYESQILKEYRDELYRYNPFMVEAYELLGKDIIESLNYSRPKIKEAMILKRHKQGIECMGFQQMIDNSFRIGSRYTLSYIKEELQRIYSLFSITPRKAITGATMNDFFHTKDCKIHGKRGYIIICRR